MHILSLDAAAHHELPFQYAAGAGHSAIGQLPFLVGVVDGLPAPLDALICASDLQGIEAPWLARGTPRLLGEAVADDVALFLQVQGLAVPQRCGVILAGDLFAYGAGRRAGVSGDVTPVWEAFRRQFRWVAGTAGNHDAWTAAAPLETFRQRRDLLYLDGDVRTVDGLRLAGVSGVIGKPHKPFRRSPDDYTAQLRRLTEQQPDLLILHESPELRDHRERGSALVGTMLETQPVPLTVCGHVHWRVPLAELPGGAQILNVDGRVVMLLRPTMGRAGGSAGHIA